MGKVAKRRIPEKEKRNNDHHSGWRKAKSERIRSVNIYNIIYVLEGRQEVEENEI